MSTRRLGRRRSSRSGSVPIDAGNIYAFTFATSGGHADFSPAFIRRKVHPTLPLAHVRPLEDAGYAVLSNKAQADRFSEVVLPHLGDALALARWLTGNAADAEDVVQDACVKAHAGIAGYAGGNPRAWLLTIVRNTSYTWLARNRPRAVVAVGDLNDLDDMSAARGVEFP